MKSFWWFDENSIAGLARPGFNEIRWLELPFDEALVLGWIGQHSNGMIDLTTLHHHLGFMAPRIFKFHKLDEATGQRTIKKLYEKDGLKETLERLNARTGIFTSLDVNGDRAHLQLSALRLQNEIAYLKSQKIHHLVSLTERHHDKEELAEHFELHHIRIDDLGAPRFEQALYLAELLKESKTRNQKIAVHCMAGIGRTSTMIAAAHIILGEDPQKTIEKLSVKNPSVALSAVLKEFLLKDLK